MCRLSTENSFDVFHSRFIGWSCFTRRLWLLIEIVVRCSKSWYATGLARMSWSLVTLSHYEAILCSLSSSQTF